jgi:hypothetical protein
MYALNMKKVHMDANNMREKEVKEKNSSSERMVQIEALVTKKSIANDIKVNFCLI